MTQLDLGILSLYLSCVFGLGLFFARHQESTQEYFLAGRNLPGWVVGFSLVATIISSATFVGHPGNVFQSDMWHIALFLPLPLVMLLVRRYLVVFYRHRLHMSAYEYLGQRFGYPAQLYGSLSFVVRTILDMSVTFYFLCVAVSFVTGWDIWWVILLLGVFTLTYTLIGGILAVIRTDVLQSILTGRRGTAVRGCGVLGVRNAPPGLDIDGPRWWKIRLGKLAAQFEGQQLLVVLGGELRLDITKLWNRAKSGPALPAGSK